jgi:hypothetical protein
MSKAKRQHYSRRAEKSDNKIKTMWGIVKRGTGKIHSTEQMLSLLTNSVKVKGP